MASIANSLLFSANNLNSRIEIYQPQPTFLKDGTRSVAYKKIAERWANVEIVSFRNENATDDALRRTVTYRIVMRFKENLLTTETLLKYKSQFLKLAAPPISLKNKFFLVDCYAEEKAVKTDGET